MSGPSNPVERDFVNNSAGRAVGGWLALVRENRQLLAIFTLQMFLTAITAAALAGTNPLLLAAVVALLAGLFTSLVVLVTSRQSGQSALSRNSWQVERSRVKSLAIYDHLPWLFNQWYFEFRLREEIERAKRYSLSIALIYLKLRDVPFDVLGMDEGELLFRLSSNIRSFDIPARIGDTEYVFCLTHCDLPQANAAASRLEARVAEMPRVIGIAVFPEDGDTVKGLVEAARVGAHSRPASGSRAA